MIALCATIMGDNSHLLPDDLPQTLVSGTITLHELGHLLHRGYHVSFSPVTFGARLMSKIRYHDFMPKEKQRGGLFGGVDFSGFDSCVSAMNDWLAQKPVNVIRVETVTLPNIHNVKL